MRGLVAALALFSFFLSGCGDPYEKEIVEPATPSQIEKLANNLQPGDKTVFLRWANRRASKERYTGEPEARTVRHAINNQVEYEAIKAKEYEEIAQQKLQRDKAIQAEQAKLDEKNRAIEAAYAHRQAVHREISETVDSKALDYKLEGQFDNFNRLIGQQWVFNIQIKNKSNKQIIGLAGYLTLKDAFGIDLGSYPFRVEHTIAPGKVVTMPLYMQDNPNDQRLRAMRSAKTLFPEWFMESLVFSDGGRIDANSVPAAGAHVSGPRKPTS